MIPRDRDGLIKWGAVAAALVIIFLLIFGGIESWNARRFEKKASELEMKVKAAEADAKEHERQAEILENAATALQTQITTIQERAGRAETALRNAKGKVITLKEEYETIRYLPVSSDPVSCANACASLAAVGYKCE